MIGKFTYEELQHEYWRQTLAKNYQGNELKMLIELREIYEREESKNAEELETLVFKSKATKMTDEKTKNITYTLENGTRSAEYRQEMPDGTPVMHRYLRRGEIERRKLYKDGIKQKEERYNRMPKGPVLAYSREYIDGVLVKIKVSDNGRGEGYEQDLRKGESLYFNNQAKPVYRLQFDGSLFFLDENGNETDAKTIANNSNLVKLHIDTQQKYMAFEEQILPTITDKDMRLHVREHGIELFEIPAILVSLRKMLGDKVQFDLHDVISEERYSRVMKGGAPSMEQVQYSLKQIRNVLSLYPHELLEKVEPSIVMGFQFGLTTKTNNTVDGLASGVAIDREAIYFNTSMADDTIHHELFHHLNDKEDNHDEEHERRMSQKVAWWLPYTNRPFNGVVQSTEDFAADPQLSAKNSTEDKAYIVSKLFSNHASEFRKIAELQERSGKPILGQKIRTIERIYYVLSKGKMDELFWEDVAVGKKINEEYWAQRTKADDFVKNPEGEKHLRSIEFHKKLAANYKEYVNNVKDGKKDPAIITSYKDALQYPLKYPTQYFLDFRAPLSNSENASSAVPLKYAHLRPLPRPS